MSAILTEGLSKQYRAVTALDGVNLNVEPGTVFGFLGPNGSGKTTTIRILTGLAPATSGRAWVAGVEVTARSRPGPSVGHLPEEPAFYSWMTPGEFLDHVGRLYGLSAADGRARTTELLGLAGLADASRRRIGGFSRGMRQRLGLAQALVNRPTVLFLDEPVSALDPAGRKDVLGLIERLRGACTVFMSTHILADVERVCDTVGILARGKLVACAPRDELLAHYAVPAFEVEAEPAGEAALLAWVAEQHRQPWVASITTAGHTARITVTDVAVARPALLASVAQANLPLARFEIVRPSLEDVFLRLVEAGAR